MKNKADDPIAFRIALNISNCIQQFSFSKSFSNAKCNFALNLSFQRKMEKVCVKCLFKRYGCLSHLFWGLRRYYARHLVLKKYVILGNV